MVPKGERAVPEREFVGAALARTSSSLEFNVIRGQFYVVTQIYAMCSGFLRAPDNLYFLFAIPMRESHSSRMSGRSYLGKICTSRSSRFGARKWSETGPGRPPDRPGRGGENVKILENFRKFRKFPKSSKMLKNARKPRKTSFSRGKTRFWSKSELFENFEIFAKNSASSSPSRRIKVPGRGLEGGREPPPGGASQTPFRVCAAWRLPLLNRAFRRRTPRTER